MHEAQRSASPRHPASPVGGVQPAHEREKASLALFNLRGLAIAFVLMTHAALAYVASAQAQPFPFDRPPYGWVIFPISGLAPLARLRRVLRLAGRLSDVVVVLSFRRFHLAEHRARRPLRFLVTPPAAGRAASFRRDGADAACALSRLPRDGLRSQSRGLCARLSHPALRPVWSAMVPVAAARVHSRRGSAASLCATDDLRIGDFSRQFEERPVRTFAACALICAAAYVPLALLFTPWSWSNHGPFAVQLCRPLLYAVYFCAGLGVGTVGLGKGMLRADGVAAKKWALWMAAAVASLALWIGLTAVALSPGPSPPLLLNVACDIELCVRRCMQRALRPGDLPALRDSRPLAVAGEAFR